MPTDRESYKINYSAPKFLGGKKETPNYFKSPAKDKPKDIEHQQKVWHDTKTGGHAGEPGSSKPASATPFKLSSGNTTSFKEMGSSPAKFWGGGGITGGFGRGWGGTTKNERKKERKKKRYHKIWNRMPEGAQKKWQFESWSKRFGIVDPAAAAVGATGGGTVSPHGEEAHTGGGTPIGGTEELPADTSEEMEMPEEGVTPLEGGMP